MPECFFCGREAVARNSICGHKIVVCLPCNDALGVGYEEGRRLTLTHFQETFLESAIKKSEENCESIGSLTESSYKTLRRQSS